MSLSRRNFLRNSAFAASAAAIGKVEIVKADEQKPSSSPAEKIGYAVVGVNGQGSNHLRALADRPDVEILYICDVDEDVGQHRCKLVGEKTGKTPQYVKDFRKALEDPAVQCVSTATPNHWHALVTITALRAGKDVYCEKPASHNVWEGRQMVNWARKLGRICQIGTQSRSSPSLHEAQAYVHSGKLGAIQYAVGTCYKPRKSIGKLDQPLQIPATIDYDLWCGPAAKVDLYRPRLHYDWHWDWNTGNGDMGNQGIHQMDIARWFLGEMQVSPRVASVGGRLGYSDAGNTPNSQIVFHAYEKAPLIFETRGLPKSGLNYDNGMDNYRGSRVGVIVQCEQGYVVIPTYHTAIVYNNDGTEVQTFEFGEDPFSHHHANFINAVRSRKHEELNADILNGHLSSALCHTGGISHQIGASAPREEIAQKLQGQELYADSFKRLAEHLTANGVDIEQSALTLGPWLEMDPATERFVSNDGANKLLTREYREGYVVPDASVA
ncbi:MAG: Gfo/Idh/MocA family oxidoreductase [Planctomycetaceae bacterium]